MKFTTRNTEHFIDKMNLDMNKEKFTPKSLLKGMNVELEHKDITGGDEILSGKIALAHLRENPNYYELLEKIESKPSLNGGYLNKYLKYKIKYLELKSKSRH